MGPVIVVGAYYVQTEAWAWEPFVASLPIGLLVAAILHANNVRDIENDRKHHKWTLAALAGRPVAVVRVRRAGPGSNCCQLSRVPSPDGRR